MKSTTKSADRTSPRRTSEPAWSAPLPRRRSRWSPWRGLALALVAGLAFGAGRAAGPASFAPVAPPPASHALLDRSLVEDAARARLVGHVGVRLLDARVEDARTLAVAYDVSGLLAPPRAFAPAHRVECAGGVLVVRGGLRMQEEVAGLIAALDPR